MHFFIFFVLFSIFQYELEREKLATELEEERKSHKERDQRIREQQMKIDNLSNLVSFSDLDRNSNQVLLSSLTKKFLSCKCYLTSILFLF